jgi:hypothetical protein
VKSLSCALFLVVLLVCSPRISHAQNPDDKNWSSSFGLPGVTGYANSPLYGGPSFVNLKDTLYLATGITEFGQQSLSGVYKWDGKNLVPFRGAQSPVFEHGSGLSCIAVDSLGRLIIGGRFDSADGRRVNNICMWNGNQWVPIGNGLEGSVSSISCSKNEMYALGNFDSSCVARWDGKSWQKIGAPLQSIWQGAAGSINCIDSIVYIFGRFSGPKYFNFGKWDGKQWNSIDRLFKQSPLTSPLDSSVYFRSVTTLGKDIYVSGHFDSVDGVYTPLLAKYDGSRWMKVGNYDIVQSGKNGGDLEYVNSNGNKLYADLVTPFVVGKDTLHGPLMFEAGEWKAIFPNRIYVNCQFGGNDSVTFFCNPWDDGTTDYFGLAQIKGNHTIPYLDSSQYGVRKDRIRSMTKVGKRIYVTGLLRNAGTLAAENIMMWENNRWEVPSFYDSIKKSIKDDINGLYGKGDSLYVFGGFHHIGSAKTDCLAMFDGIKWNSYVDSTYWMSPNSPYSISQMVIDDSGNIYTNNFIVWHNAKWNRIPFPTRSNDTTGQITAMATDGRNLFISLQYSEPYNDNVGTDILQWDGTEWRSLTNSGILTNILREDSLGDVRCLAFQNGKLVVNGGFTQIAGVAMNNIGYWDGTSWHSFGKGLSYDENNYRTSSFSYDRATSIQFDGENMYVAGRFTHADSILTPSIAHWDGKKWNRVGSGLLYNTITQSPSQKTECGYVNSLVIMDGKLFAAGYFTRAGNKPAYNFSYYILPEKSSVHSLPVTTDKKILTLYPDPATSELTLSLSDRATINKIEIIDMLGRVIKSYTSNLRVVDQGSVKLTISDVPTGSYIARVSAKNTTSEAKFSVSR